jgi:hypothetical protein
MNALADFLNVFTAIVQPYRPDICEVFKMIYLMTGENKTLIN